MQITQDLTHPEVIEDPYKYYGKLRESNPVYYNEKWGGHIITRYDNVARCLQDTQHLSREVGMDRLPEDSQTAKIFSRWMLFRDPPEQTRLRTLTLEAFNAKAIEELRPEIKEITQNLIREIEGEDEIEFIQDFAYLLPVRVICEILGIPIEDKDRIKKWSSDLMLTLQHMYGEKNRRERTEQSMREFSDYLREIVEQRKVEPRDDLITHLIEAQDEGQMLGDDEVIATAMLLLVGGHETTTNLIANGLYLLLEHPDQIEILRRDSSLTADAVEEMLRYQGTLKAVTREVAEGFELDGEQIEVGERLLLVLAAANRDPQKFDDPEEFDITRQPEDHLGFGGGIHYCIGAPLARQETEVAISALLDTFPEIELATDDIEWRRSVTARALKELPLRL